MKSLRPFLISLLLFSFLLYFCVAEGSEPSSSEQNASETVAPEVEENLEKVELNKDTKKKKPREYASSDDEDEFEAEKRRREEARKSSSRRNRRRRYDDYDDEDDDEDYPQDLPEEDDEEYERHTKPKSRKDREQQAEREAQRERDLDKARSQRQKRRPRPDPYDSLDDYDEDPEEYFERQRARDRRAGPRRHSRPDFERDERLRDRDRYRRPPPMDDYPEYRRRRDRRDDVDREKHFEEMKRRMQDRENSGDHYKTDKAEKQQPVVDKYEIILWGEEHPFLSHWISQVANMAPENGVLANDWMRREASHISITVDDFKNNYNVDLTTELLYTGYIEYEQRLKDYDIHITNKFVPYIACRPKARRVLKEEEKKTDL